MRTTATHLAALIVFAAALLLAGCPDQTGQQAGPVDECEKAGQQCRLGSGKLGVCMADPDGQLECTSQH